MCGLPYRIRLALVQHGLSDWPFCGQIEVTKWAFAAIGHHSSLCPKDTTFEKVRGAICARKLPQHLRVQWPQSLATLGPGVQVRKKK